jgi:hypothetical protein
MPWLIELVQNYNGGTPRYLGGEEVGLLTATPRRAMSYSSQEGAAAAAAKLEPHKWGRWEAREVAT